MSCRPEPPAVSSRGGDPEATRRNGFSTRRPRMLGKQCAFHVRIMKLPSLAHPPGLSPGRPPPGHRDPPTATAPERKAFRTFPGLPKSWKWELKMAFNLTAERTTAIIL